MGGKEPGLSKPSLGQADDPAPAQVRQGGVRNGLRRDQGRPVQGRKGSEGGGRPGKIHTHESPGECSGGGDIIPVPLRGDIIAVRRQYKIVSLSTDRENVMVNVLKRDRENVTP